MADAERVLVLLAEHVGLDAEIGRLVGVVPAEQPDTTSLLVDLGGAVAVWYVTAQHATRMTPLPGGMELAEFAGRPGAQHGRSGERREGRRAVGKATRAANASRRRS